MSAAPRSNNSVESIGSPYFNPPDEIEESDLFLSLPHDTTLTLARIPLRTRRRRTQVPDDVQRNLLTKRHEIEALIFKFNRECEKAYG